MQAVERTAQSVQFCCTILIWLFALTGSELAGPNDISRTEIPPTHLIGKLL